MKTALLVLCPVAPANLETLRQRYDVTYAPTPAERQAAIAQHGARFQAVVT
ncbi:MAG: 2-hydroxyacid dehydrogenase, partial [Bordetella sp.]|nr:2-hydroxyacid dehydrogenase [Bordetella sp.]